jgi:serine/threonine protein kinase
MQANLDNEAAIFQAASAMPAGEGRDAYLSEACQCDPALLGRVVELLRLFDSGQASLGSPWPMVETNILRSNEMGHRGVDLSPGSQIGPYKLLEQLGEGGMGIVYMAEQTRPVRRRVALKIIKPGMDSRQVVARFEAERQALALMDHAHVAKVFDGGTTETGRPYFVMELVRGLPITEYCDQRRLTILQRLTLFTQVCQAVQHAHQKGIIHRDLKPTNVLVAHDDTVPLPKIIDFGIAKAVSQPLTERTLFTAVSQMVGSPLYMSPEQAELNHQDVDTRSDVYSLGVLLYELLTGTTPFESDKLKEKGLDEMRRMIREDEPHHPSYRISTLKADACSTASERRGIDARQLKQLICGELDWIVMKALDKDRRRRYQSAS